MTDLVVLTEYLAKRLVADQDSVIVKEASRDENSITIQILVDEKDMPVVIGKGGATINAIRTIVQASSYINKQERVYINVDSKKEEE